MKYVLVCVIFILAIVKKLEIMSSTKYNRCMTYFGKINLGGL